MANSDGRGSRGSEEKQDQKSWHFGWRYLTAALGFLAMFNSYTMRNHLSVTMVAMVYDNSSSNHTPECTYNDDSDDGSTDAKQGPFDWDSKLQGIIFGGFYWGYIIPQVFGGRMAELYGPKIVVFCGGLLATVATAIGPWAANVNVWFFFATRVLVGMGLAVFTPSLHRLISQWSPPNERSRFSAWVYSGNQFGVVVSMPVASALCKSDLNGGWPWPFYTFAIVSGVWLVLWLIVVKDSPAENKWMSNSEREMIERKLDTSVREERLPVPYKHIFKSKAFWGLMWAHFGHNWGYYTLMTQIPTYMNDVLQFDLQENGLLSAIPYLVLMVIGFIASMIADYIIKSKRMSVTHVRKTSQSIAFCGSAMFLLIITFLTCNKTAIYALLVMAVGWDGGSYGGFQINHVDLSPNFAGTLQGFTNTLGCIPGIVSPYITGVVTSGTDNQDSWNIIFYITFAIYIATTAEYIILGSGELQYWNDISNLQVQEKSSHNVDGKSKQSVMDAVIAVPHEIEEEKSK
ncbi:hypothetical protein CHUAL_009884 [Chamberlinius hualienensis]